MSFLDAPTSAAARARALVWPAPAFPVDGARTRPRAARTTLAVAGGLAAVLGACCLLAGIGCSSSADPARPGQRTVDADPSSARNRAAVDSASRRLDAFNARNATDGRRALDSTLAADWSVGSGAGPRLAGRAGHERAARRGR